MNEQEFQEHIRIARRLAEMQRELREIHEKFAHFNSDLSCRMNEPCASLSRAEIAIRHATFEAAHRFAQVKPELTWLYHRPDLYDTAENRPDEALR